MKEIKSGSEIVEAFFSELEKSDTLDKEVVKVLVDLYKQSKFTSTNIGNQLEDARKKAINVKNK